MSLQNIWPSQNLTAGSRDSERSDFRKLLNDGSLFSMGLFCSIKSRSLFSLVPTLLTLFSVISFGGETSAIPALHRLELPGPWIQGHAVAPNIFFAFLPQEDEGVAALNFLSIQEHPVSDNKVLRLRKELKVSPGEPSCLELPVVPSLDGSPKKSLNIWQTWCFGEKKVFALIERSQARIDSEIRRPLLDWMKRSVK